MARHDPGPRRSESVDSYLQETRAIAAVALLALVGGVVSDELAPHFWGHHALLAGLASSLISVVLTVALVNEAVERRKRERWSVLAQYVMLQLVRDARLVWTGVAELVGLMPSGTYTASSIDRGASAVRDAGRLAPAISELVADADRRRQLRGEIALLVAQSDEVLGRWAAVMLNVDAYAEVVDRHVELAGDLAWSASLLDHFEPPDDHRRPWKGRSHSPIQVEGEVNHERLADTLVAITQLAERLDRGTLELALRIVPVGWWAARLGKTPPAPTAELELVIGDQPAS